MIIIIIIIMNDSIYLVEKYKISSPNDLVFNKNAMEDIINCRDNFMLIGYEGTGKQTLINIYLNETIINPILIVDKDDDYQYNIYCSQYHFYYNYVSNGTDKYVIQNKIPEFLSQKSFGNNGNKIIIIDNFDKISKLNQLLLISIIETYKCDKFIFICNNLCNVVDNIKNNFKLIYAYKPSYDELFTIGKTIIYNEKIIMNDETINDIINYANFSIGKFIWYIECEINNHGSYIDDWKNIIKFIVDGCIHKTLDIATIRKYMYMITINNISIENICKEILLILKDHDKIYDIIEYVSNIDYMYSMGKRQTIYLESIFLYLIGI